MLALTLCQTAEGQPVALLAGLSGSVQMLTQNYKLWMQVSPDRVSANLLRLPFSSY